MEHSGKPIDDIPLHNLDLQFVIHNMLRQRGIERLSDVLNLIKHPPDDISVRARINLSYTRKELLSQGYLLYDHGNQLRTPTRAAQLKWLADTQSELGVWIPEKPDIPTGAMPEFNFTLAATLSLIRAGHTSTRGQYAPVVARAMRWLEMDRPLPNETMAYGLLRVLAENYNMPPPVLPFKVPAQSQLTTFDHIRQWALVYGNAPIYPWRSDPWADPAHYYHGDINHNNQYFISHSIQMAWATIDAPKSTP